MEEIKEDIPSFKEQEVQADNSTTLKKSLKFAENQPAQMDKVTEQVFQDNIEESGLVISVQFIKFSIFIVSVSGRVMRLKNYRE